LTLLSHGIVHAVPPRITEIPHNQEVTVSGRIELECAAEGLPTPVISWRVNSTEYPGTIPLRSYIRFTRRCITQRYAENGQLAFVSRILMDFRCIIIVVLFSSAWKGRRLSNPGVQSSPLVDEERMSPADDIPWLGSMLFLSFGAFTLLFGWHEGHWATYPSGAVSEQAKEDRGPRGNLL